MGVSRQDIQKRLSRWLINQYWASLYDLGDTQRQAQELISGPCTGNKVKFLSFNRTQSRVETDLLTGHNTLRRHLYLLELLDSPLCSVCGVEEENSSHILCECEPLASLRHIYLGSFFLEPEDIKEYKLGGHLELWQDYRAPTILIWGTKGPFIRPRCIGAMRSHTQM